MTRHYLTRERIKVVAGQMSRQDLEIVRTLHRLRLLSASQIGRLFFVSSSDAQACDRHCRRVLSRLVEKRVFARLDRRVGGVRAGSSGFVYRLDVAGQYITREGGKRRRRPETPGLAFIKHRLAVSELFVSLTEAEKAGSIKLVEFLAEPYSWRSFFGAGGVPAWLKSDAFVHIYRDDVERACFVEVDLGTESSAALNAKLPAYRGYFASGKEQKRLGLFPKVVFLVPSERRKAQVVDAFAGQPEEAWELFQVGLLEDAVAVLIGSVAS